MDDRLATVVGITLIGFACYAATELSGLVAYRVLVKAVLQAFA